MRHHIQKWRDESEFGVMVSLNWEKMCCLQNLVCVGPLDGRGSWGQDPLLGAVVLNQATLPWGIWQYLEALLVMIVASSG